MLDKKLTLPMSIKLYECTFYAIHKGGGGGGGGGAFTSHPNNMSRESICREFLFN